MGTAKFTQCWLPAEAKVQNFYTVVTEGHDGNQAVDLTSSWTTHKKTHNKTTKGFALKLLPGDL